MAVHRRPRAAGAGRSRRPRPRSWPCTRFRGSRLANRCAFAGRVDASCAGAIRCRARWVGSTWGEPYKRRGNLAMKVRGVVVALTALLVLAVAVPASAGVGLNAYRANAKGLKQLRELKRLGFDLTEGQRKKGVEIVATKAQVRKLRRAGIKAKLIRTKRGRTALRAGAAQAAGGYAGLASVRAHRHRRVGRRGQPHGEHQDADGEPRQEVPEHHEARDDRALAPRPAHLRDEGHEERGEA